MIKTLINADDFGYSRTVNIAITKLIEAEFVSSTTIIANMDGFDDAAEIVKQNELFKNKVGLHLNITEGKPLTTDILKYKLFCNEDQEFSYKRKSKFLFTNDEKCALKKEINAQIVRCFDNGIHLTHSDSHRHTLFDLPVLNVALPVYKKHKINCLRNYYYQEFQHTTLRAGMKYLYGKYYQSVLLKNNIKTTSAFFRKPDDIKNLKNLDSFELMIHPDIDKEGIIFDRVENLDYSIISAHYKAVNIQMISFNNI